MIVTGEKAIEFREIQLPTSIGVSQKTKLLKCPRIICTFLGFAAHVVNHLDQFWATQFTTPIRIMRVEVSLYDCALTKRELYKFVFIRKAVTFYPAQRSAFFHLRTF